MEENEKKKKSKKGKWILRIICILPFLVVIGFLFLYDGSINYKLSADGTYYVVTGISPGPLRQMDEIVIPKTHRRLPVKAISNGALNVKEHETTEAITSISLPDTLEAISWNVFNGSAYYNDESSWEIEMDSKGNELYRALYISEYLIEVRYNDEYIGEDGKLPTFTVKEGTLGIAAGAFKSTNEDADYDTIIVEIKSNDLAFVGNSCFYNSSVNGYAMDSETDSLHSESIFSVDCDNYIIHYNGLMSEWLKFESRGNLGGGNPNFIYCLDGIINTDEIE